MLTVISKGIAKIPFLDVFLRSNFQLCQEDTSYCQGVVGWGRRSTTIKARRMAKKRGLPFISLEDGFIRSFGTGNNFPPLSLVVDNKGIYYDATTISELEEVLNSEKDVLSYRQDEVTKAKQLICQHRISKYNHAPLLDITQQTDTKKILVVDQTYGDMSVQLGGGNQQIFIDMLNVARHENPDAKIYIKTHPEVSSGTKNGYLTSITEDDQTILLKSPCNPIHLIEQMDHIYVVTSTMGFEALLIGKPVSVFGLPWYSNWGVTDDRQSCAHRTRTRTVDELFAVAYFDYARYINPETKYIGTLFDVIKWLERQKRQTKRFSGRMICVGFRRWKAVHLSPILSLHQYEVIFVKNAQKAEKLNLTSEDNLLFWGCSFPDGLKQLSEKYSAKLVRVEDGFIRSVGLGSDLIRPMSIVLDKSGLYFDPTKTSDLEYILNNEIFSQEDHVRAAWIKAFIIKHGITKYNIESVKNPNWNSQGKPILLIIGQVEDDASILYGTSKIKKNTELLQTVRKCNPNAWIVFKPHPDVLSGNRKGKLKNSEVLQWANHIETEVSIVSCVEHSDEVHTITSLSGFDALLRGKKVFAYGQPFYSGWGLLENDIFIPRRLRKLTLDELIIGVLIKYPVYWDWKLKGYTSCEAVLREIQKQKNKQDKTSMKINYFQRQARKLRTLLKSFIQIQINSCFYMEKKSNFKKRFEYFFELKKIIKNQLGTANEQ